MTAGVKRAVKTAADLLPLAAALIAVVYWAMTQLAGKADAGELEDARGEIRTLQVQRAEEKVADAWRDAALFEIAKKVGALVPPPPGGTP